MLAHRQSSTNLVPYCADFSQWTTYKLQAITYGQTDIIKSGTDATKLEPDTSNSGAHHVRWVLSGRTTGQVYVYSVSAKPDGIGGLSINVDGPDTDSNCVGFNLTTGAVHGSTASILWSGIAASANGYYRCYFAHEYTGTNTNLHLIVSDTSAFEANGSFLGWDQPVAGTLGVNIFGAQAELIDLTDLVYTNGAAATFTQDTYKVPYTSNFYTNYGIILFRYTIRNAVTTPSGLISCTGAVDNTVLWQEAGGVFKTHDSVNTTTHTAAHNVWTDVLAALCYRADSNSLSIMTSLDGASFTSTDGTYDGSYTLANSNIHIALESPSIDIRAFNIYHTGFDSTPLADMKNWVIANAAIETPYT